LFQFTPLARIILKPASLSTKIFSHVSLSTAIKDVNVLPPPSHVSLSTAIKDVNVLPPPSHVSLSTAIKDVNVLPPPSHAWLGTVSKLFDTIFNFLRSASEDTQVWIDFVAVNQARSNKMYFILQ
jgi:hypothetical protein